MYKEKKIFIVLFLSFFTSSLNAVITGSTSAVSRQYTPALFPYTDTNNQLLGFTAAQQGLVLARSDTTSLFSAFFPISTSMDLRGGGLFLNYDMTLDQTVSFLSTGSFSAAGGSAINLPAINTSLGFPSAVDLLAFVGAASQVTASPTADWSFDSQYVASALSTDIEIYRLTGSTFSLILDGSTTSGAPWTCIRWYPGSSYYLAAGYNGGGSGRLRTFLFNPSGPTLTPISQLASGSAMGTVALAFSPSGLFIAFTSPNTVVAVASFNPANGVINLLGSALAVTNTISPLAMDWIDNAYFVVGLTGGAQLRVYKFNGTNTITQAATSTPGNTVTAVAPAQFNGYIAVGLSGGTNNIQMYQFTGGNTLTQITSIPETLAVTSMDWSPTGSFIAVGLATSATESQIRVYYFNPTTLTFTVTGQVSSPAPSTNDIRWSPNSQYLVTADNNTTGNFTNAVTVYQLLSQTMPFVFFNTKMIMNSALIMSAPILFQGLCEIEGNNNILDVSQIQNFSVATTSTLLLKNMTLQGINGTNINCVDTTGVLQLQNLNWVQTNTFRFTQGALQISNSVMFTGTSPLFIYQSAQPCTINSNSRMMFDANMTFSYAPSSNANNLIMMTDQTSILYFMNANLFASAVGMQLTKGTVVIDGPCTCTSFAINSGQGVSFGDGLSAANNCTVKVLPESGLFLNSGFLIHNNV